MNESTKQFLAAWITGSLVFGIIMCLFIFQDGVVDEAKVVVTSIAFLLVTVLFGYHCKQRLK